MGAGLATLLTITVLAVMGFSPIGPVAGNVDPFVQRRCLIELIFVPATLLCYRMLGMAAAGIQAGIGNVAAGSPFAIAQATAMGGGILKAIAFVGGLLGGLFGAFWS